MNEMISREMLENPTYWNIKLSLWPWDTGYLNGQTQMTLAEGACNPRHLQVDWHEVNFPNVASSSASVSSKFDFVTFFRAKSDELEEKHREQLNRNNRFRFRAWASIMLEPENRNLHPIREF